MSTVAECVESAEDAALLRAEGVSYLQGYHIGAPTVERLWLAKPAPERREESSRRVAQRAGGSS